MFGNIFVCYLVIVSVWSGLLQSAAQQTPVYGSTVIPAGNPRLPSFQLSTFQTDNLPSIHPDVYQDTLLPTHLLASKRGYKTELHRVVTSDGYILEVHRIVSSPLNLSPAQKKPVAFLQHGLLESSATWVMSGPRNGFGYALADAGYDVWMGNARGNVYSRKHVRYDPDGSISDRQNFWTFSWHEIGLIDVPEMLDYVLDKTNQTDLFYIGHSQGTTAFFVMCSERPEYNAKIKMMHALAPVAYMNNAISPIIRVVDSTTLRDLAALLGAYEFLPSIDLFRLIGQTLCRDTSPFIAICESVVFLITGFNEQNINATLFPVFLSHTPAGASTYQLVHYAQGAKTARFCGFDWGNPIQNMAKHGSPVPPDYKLHNVVARVILHYADNDWLASPIDVERLHANLPNSERNHIPDKKFEHMDFVWGMGARKDLYEPIIASMKLYDSITGKLKG